VNCDRGNLHRHLHNVHIYSELLLKISIALKTNFFVYYFDYVNQILENEHFHAIAMRHNTDANIDIGFAVRKKMSEQGAAVAWLARQVNCDRGNLHRHLHNVHIYPELLLKISIELKTNFFVCYFDYVNQILENEQNYIP